MQYFCTTKSGGTLALLPEENSYSVPDLRFKDFADLALQQFHVGRTCSQMKWRKSQCAGHPANRNSATWRLRTKSWRILREPIETVNTVRHGKGIAPPDWTARLPVFDSLYKHWFPSPLQNSDRLYGTPALVANGYAHRRFLGSRAATAQSSPLQCRRYHFRKYGHGVVTPVRWIRYWLDFQRLNANS